jgi:hypothetical protein
MEHSGYDTTSLREEKSRLEKDEEKEKRLTRPQAVHRSSGVLQIGRGSATIHRFVYS